MTGNNDFYIQRTYLQLYQSHAVYLHLNGRTQQSKTIAVTPVWNIIGVTFELCKLLRRLRELQWVDGLYYSGEQGRSVPFLQRGVE